MVKQTIELIIKAIIIGVLVNVGVQQVPAKTPVQVETIPQVEQQPLQHPAPETPADFPAKAAK
jgi:hypothetical protein